MDIQNIKKRVIAGVVVGFVAGSILSCIEIVDNDHRGIKYNINGGVEETVLKEGWKLLR